MIKSKNNKSTIYLIVKLSAIIFTLFGLAAFFHGLYEYFSLSSKEFSLNELGDYIGGVSGSLWAVVSILILYLNILNQKDEIKKSTSRIDKKDFESLLYKMLELHNNRIHNFDVDEKKGIDCFKSFWDKTQYFYTDSKIDKEIDKINDVLNQIEHAFPDDIPLYLNSLTGILDYIKDSNEVEDKEKYYKLLFRQLSMFEILLIYLYSLTQKEFKCLFTDIEKLKKIIVNEEKEIKILTLKQLIDSD